MPTTDILLLHGALGAQRQLVPLAGLLSDSFTIHSIDFEGHGESEERGRAFSIGSFAENVVDYLDEHSIDRVDIFGYSMGGYVGAFLAGRQPERIGRLFTLGTKWRWDPETAQREVRLLDAGKIAEKVPKFAQTLKDRHTGAGWEAVLRKTGDMMLGLGDANVLADNDLRAITLPLRVGVGDRDSTVTVEESAEVYRLLPNGELQVFPGTPHPLEKVSLPLLAQGIRAFFVEPA